MQNNTHSSRWRRAAHELQELKWWQGSICVGGLLGWAGWLAPSALGLPVGPLSGEAPRALAAAIGLVGGALLVPVAVFLWFYWRAPWRVLTNLQERITALEDAKAARPNPRVRFEYDRKVQRVRLYVTNQGGEAAFSAPMVIDGPLSAPPVEPVFASWEHTSDVSTHIARGETRALHLATLDTTSFPFAHWQVRVTADGRGASEVPAMHTSVVGGLPDTQAPRLLLHVTVVSAPDAAGGIPSRVIALDPFGATLLTR